MTTDPQKIIDALSLKDLEPEEQEEMLEDIHDLVFKGTMVRIIEMLDDKARDEFSAMLENDLDEETIEAFISSHIPNADQVVQDTMDELTDDILAVTE